MNLVVKYFINLNNDKRFAGTLVQGLRKPPRDREVMSSNPTGHLIHIFHFGL